MFNKKDNSYKEGFDTLIGENTTFEGNIESEGTVRVEGKLKGDIKAEGDVLIGQNSHITGNITAGNISLSGTVEGNIYSAGILRILSTAKLYGDIQVRSFVADEGALFQGNCSMVDSTEPSGSSGKKTSKKSSRDYKKSSVLDQIYDEKEKTESLNG